jgi:signal transduction histidine kinase/DNA-binding LacI/PurR family transcriptional regulator/CheY-like chemotaxis protein/HPt (histidine-containing phosphotransfer) domain-containing protein
VEENDLMARVCRIGFLVDGLLSRYQVRLFEAIRRAARRRDAIVISFPGSYLGSNDAQRATFDGSFVFDLAGPTSVDGIIVASNLILTTAGASRVQSLCERTSVPVVSIGPMPGITTVDVDNRSGLKQVIEHLVFDHGHRRLAFIRGPLINPDSLDRERVFRSTLEALGVEVHCELIVTGNFLESSGAAAVRTLLGERRMVVQDVDAIVAANDQMATGAMQELSARGLRVPDDIAVVGFDDDDYARSASPPLTTVAQPLERLGETTVGLLIEKIHGHDVQEKTILDTVPVLRRSCGCREPRVSAPKPESGGIAITTRPDQLRTAGMRQFEWRYADERAKVGIDCARSYLNADSEADARDLLLQIERIVFELAAVGVDPLQWQDVFSPVHSQGTCFDGAGADVMRRVARGQRLHCLFSEIAAGLALKEQLRTIELANSLRVIGSAVVCARHFRALARVLDAGLPGIDVRYCCVCVFTDQEHTNARAVAVYNPTVPKPHAQIHSAEQLWRAVPPTLPPGAAPSSIGVQSFPAAALLPPSTTAPSSGDFLVFPLMFGEEALGYLVLDAPSDAQRAWLLEGLSGHLSSAIYEISRTEQLRVAREMAEAANSAKSAFVAMMSHEVRTPLNAIMGNLDLCLRTELPKEQRKLLLRAQTSSRTLRSIVDDILDYSRIEANRIELESVSFELEEVLEQVIGSCASEASRKNLELILDVDCSIPQRLVGDPLRLTQVLSNLVNNAVKFSNRGYVALRINRNESEPEPQILLQFDVEDTGIGMTPEQIARVFQPFTQADNSITRRYGGTGLGLTICRRFVELMGGEILLRSELGVGSTFEFILPFQSGSESSTSASMAPKTVILVTESPVQSAALRRLFESMGHDVVAAHSGKEALSLVAQAQPRDGEAHYFVFADHRLPDMDGVEFSRKLREIRANCRLSLILLVPYDNDALLTVDWQNVAESVLAKPPLRGSIQRIFERAEGVRVSSNPPASERQVGQNQLTGRRILVVQDSEISRELACELLALNGAETLTATDGTEAIRVAQNERLDLILMDLHLPGVDGCAASRSIRNYYDSVELPIIALSASASPEDRSRCLDAGMNDFLHAPIGAAELVDVVQRWLTGNGGVPGGASSAPPASAAVRMTSPMSPVLEIAKALGRLGGNRTLYRQLLKRFAQSHATALDELSMLLDEGDNQRAASVAHILVSAAGNIGATQLQHAAQSLEVALRQSDAQRILELRPRFEAEWHTAIQAVIRATGHLDGSFPPPVTHATPLAHEHIEELRRLLREHDTAAVELLERLQEDCLAEPPVKEALQRLAQSVSSYDFEEARLHLDSLANVLTAQLSPDRST